MTAEHAHGIDTGGEVDVAGWLRDWRLTDCEHAHDPSPLSNGLTCCSPCLRDRILASGLLTTRQAAADAVLAEARQLCCGENPSPHHAASAKHSELMAFAGDLARAVRGL